MEKQVDVSKQKRVTQEQLKVMLQFVLLEYPDIIRNSVQIAINITKDFNVLCLPRDIEEYYVLQSCGEDYELEERRHTYDIRM